MVYKIKVHREVINEDSRHFDRKTREKIKKKCQELLSRYPEEAGESLRLDLQGYRKLKIFNDYRVVYRVNRKEATVFILAVGIRRDLEVYEEAIRHLRSSH